MTSWSVLLITLCSLKAAISEPGFIHQKIWWIKNLELNLQFIQILDQFQNVPFSQKSWGIFDHILANDWFDMVERSTYRTYISRFEHWCSVRLALFLPEGQNLLCSVGKFLSTAAPIFCEVPQGSTLRLLLFSLSLLLFVSVLRKHACPSTVMPDDCQK